MEARYLDLAAELCDLAKVDDLFELFSIDRHADPERVSQAISQYRRKMQGMQANPKFKTQARFFIKHAQAISSVLEEPAEYCDYLRAKAEDESLPSLHLAIDGILADGIVSEAEERFVRDLAENLGISQDRCMRELADRAASVGAAVPSMLDPTRSDHARAMSWWDSHFTRLLLEAIPDGAGEMVDIYCRMAWSALTLLPRRPKLKYLGIDRNPDRISMARSSLQTLGPRVALRVGPPDDLPLPDESVDIVLAVRALQTRDDTRSVLAEAYRVLRQGGRCIMVEPDGLAEQFYFDGSLDAYTLAFRGLVAEAERRRAHGLPEVPAIGRGGMSLGPQLFARLKHAGFTPRELNVHSSQNMWIQPLEDLERRLRAYARAIAKAHGISSKSPEWTQLAAATQALQARAAEGAEGLGGNLLPLFIATGVKA
ncbi:MAG: methyltransferase domain-containing protein [Deltaproteobacteria bacterium]|nr:MAG: methyltransferase domain-containing protein [Deltaproteobacteria bacterium]